MTLSLIPQEALAVFVLLLAAHVLADFLFQTNAMVRNKRHPAVFALHIACVAGLSALALWGAWQAVVAVTLAHLAIDLVKTYLLPAAWRDTLGAFLGDQAAHLVSLALVALWQPLAAAQGPYAPGLPLILPAATLIAGFGLTVMAGGPAVGLLTRRFGPVGNGLPEAGRMIGQLERALIFLLIAMGEPAAIGFLIAAKSVLRFEAAKENQRLSEYVIIGTLASFGWAIALSWGTQAVLEIVATNP